MQLQMQSVPRSPDNCSTIVIVDDDDAVRSALQLRLELEGQAVAAFATAEAALAACVRAACFVLDLKLPGMSGLECLAVFRSRGHGAPAILITSQPSHSVRRQAAAAGALLVEKPLLGDVLLEAVQRAVGSG